MKIYSIIFCLMLLSIPVAAATDYTESGRFYRIEGQVTDKHRQAVVGATVMIIVDDRAISGTATDSDGRYSIKLSGTAPQKLIARVSSIGYTSAEAEVSPVGKSTTVDLVIEARTIAIAGIKVVPKASFSPAERTISSRQLRRRAQNSLVSTNLVAAIREPQVLRQGSGHSSKIRISGTNPVYYLNGTAIGQDPNHYGMFAIIPASVVQKIKLHSNGTEADHAQPAALELYTPARFENHAEGDFNLSVIEATGAYSFGTDKFFSISSLRKSVLDKLVEQFDVHSDRMTLPPTNFQDVFNSSGLKLSPRYRLFLDQYHVRDFLSYRVQPTAGSPASLSTYQHNVETYFGLRFEAVYDNLLLKLSGGSKSSSEQYIVGSDSEFGMKVDLATRQRYNFGKVEAVWLKDNSQLSIGSRIEAFTDRHIRMDQLNWNFLPPDANSDTPYLFQQILNQQYGSFEGGQDETNLAGYVTLSHDFDRLSLSSGVRLERFGNLRNGQVLQFRERLTLKVGEESQAELFWGTFAENPIGRILEPYQLLVHDNLSTLEPIRTNLLSAGYRTGPLNFRAFTKNISRIPYPVPIPDTLRGFDVQQAAPEFAQVEMLPSESVRFTGADIAFSAVDLFVDGLDIYSFYGYTVASKKNGLSEDLGIQLPYELNAPHKFYNELSYRAGKVVTVGFNLAVRSGYAYTPSSAMANLAQNPEPGIDDLASATLKENSKRFPVNYSLDAHLTLALGNTDLFFNVANVTNRANPIISTANGFVYDAGILPSFGLRWRF